MNLFCIFEDHPLYLVMPPSTTGAVEAIANPLFCFSKFPCHPMYINSKKKCIKFCKIFLHAAK